MPRRSWTIEQKRLLRETFKNSTWDELLALFPSKTRSAIKTKASSLGLKRGDRYVFSLADDRYLREHYAGTQNSKLAEHLGCKIASLNNRAQKLGLKKDKSFLRKQGERLHVHGKAYQFKKGNVPKNKGKKQIEYMSKEAIARTAKTRFKKGNIPHNHKPLGYSRVNRDGYIEVKVKEPNVFKLKHRIEWEKHKGPIPEGYNVQFKDKNSLNTNIENLYIISREEQMRDNSIHNYPDNLQKAIRLVSKLNKTINKQKKHDNKKAN